MIIKTKNQFCNMTQTVTIEDAYQELKVIEKTKVTQEDLDVLIDFIKITQENHSNACRIQ
jgi:hypothetical protein